MLRGGIVVLRLGTLQTTRHCPCLKEYLVPMWRKLYKHRKGGGQSEVLSFYCGIWSMHTNINLTLYHWQKGRKGGKKGGGGWAEREGRRQGFNVGIPPQSHEETSEVACISLGCWLTTGLCGTWLSLPERGPDT